MLTSTRRLGLNNCMLRRCPNEPPKPVCKWNHYVRQSVEVTRHSASSFANILAPSQVRIHSLRCEDFLAAPREFRPAVDAITRSFPAASPERSPVQILSLRFLNDTTLVSLARTSATSTSLFFLKRVRPERRLSDNQWSQWVETGRFDDREGFEPVSMEVKETGQYPTGRICLLGRSGERLVILEVDRDGKAG